MKINIVCAEDITIYFCFKINALRKYSLGIRLTVHIQVANELKVSRDRLSSKQRWF